MFGRDKVDHSDSQPFIIEEFPPCSLGPVPHMPNPLRVVGPPRKKRSLIRLGV